MKERPRNPLITPLVVAAMLLACKAPPARAADAPKPHENWYVVTIQGQRAGWVHEEQRVAADRITTDSTMSMSIKRGAMPLTIVMSTSFAATPDGKPLVAVSNQTFGKTEIRKTITFTDDGMDVVETQGDRTQERHLPTPQGEWMPPAAAAQYVADRMAAGDKRIAYSTFDPSTSLTPLDIVVKVYEETDVELYGRKVRGVRREVYTSALPGMVTEEYADRDGTSLRTKVKFGGLEMELIAADKELAMSPISPPELLMNTLITPAFHIDKPRELRRAVYRLTVSEGELPDLLTTPTQRFERIDARSATVTVDLNHPVVNADDARPAIKQNMMIDGADKVIVDLATKALVDQGDDPAMRAEALRRYTRGYISRADLSVGMASASEVARTRVGDCTEHGVLLAALIKAAGIPARVASGIIYVNHFAGADHIFGYHMWSQAWLNGRWVDLDATIGNDFDAAHITLTTSDLGDEHMTNDMVVLGPLLGRLKIERLDTGE